jgi:hypothetical protein
MDTGNYMVTPKKLTIKTVTLFLRTNASHDTLYVPRDTIRESLGPSRSFGSLTILSFLSVVAIPYRYFNFLLCMYLLLVF